MVVKKWVNKKGGVKKGGVKKRGALKKLFNTPGLLKNGVLKEGR